MAAKDRTRVVVAHIAASVRQILRGGLEARGYDVVTTAGGAEAIRLVVDGPATRVRAGAAGFDAYFALPVDPFDLVDRLEALGLTAAGEAE